MAPPDEPVMGSAMSASPLLQAYLSVRRGLPNVEFLMTVAALGSVALGDYVEAASVCVTFYVDMVCRWVSSHLIR